MCYSVCVCTALMVYLQDVTIYEQSLSVMIGEKAGGPFCELKSTITYKEGAVSSLIHCFVNIICIIILLI